MPAFRRAASVDRHCIAVTANADTKIPRPTFANHAHDDVLALLIETGLFVLCCAIIDRSVHIDPNTAPDR
jgi:hypothetical protein